MERRPAIRAHHDRPARNVAHAGRLTNNRRAAAGRAAGPSLLQAAEEEEEEDGSAAPRAAQEPRGRSSGRPGTPSAPLRRRRRRRAETAAGARATRGRRCRRSCRMVGAPRPTRTSTPSPRVPLWRPRARVEQPAASMSPISDRPTCTTFSRDRKRLEERHLSKSTSSCRTSELLRRHRTAVLFINAYEAGERPVPNVVARASGTPALLTTPRRRSPKASHGPFEPPTRGRSVAQFERSSAARSRAPSSRPSARSARARAPAPPDLLRGAQPRLRRDLQGPAVPRARALPRRAPPRQRRIRASQEAARRKRGRRQEGARTLRRMRSEGNERERRETGVDNTQRHRGRRRSRTRSAAP